MIRIQQGNEAPTAVACTCGVPKEQGEFLLGQSALSRRLRSTMIRLQPRSIFVLLLCALLAATPFVSLLSTKESPSRRSLPQPLHEETTPQILPLPPPPMPLVSLSPLLLAPCHPVLNREAIVSILLKPVVVELGVVVVCQAVGLPLLSKLGMVLRRVRAPSLLSRSVSSLRLLQRFPAVSRVVHRPLRILTTHSGRAWKAFGHFYKQTSLSKIVNRSKKLLKVFVHHEDHDHDHQHPH